MSKKKLLSLNILEPIRHPDGIYIVVVTAGTSKGIDPAYAR